MHPYPTFGPPGYVNPAAADLPTTSPPPEYVSAALTFDVVNLGSEDIAPGWNFTLTNSFYTRIDQACDPSAPLLSVCMGAALTL